VTPENLNLNIDAKTLEQCLKATTNFGGTIYTNICTGTQSVIPWGTADWALGVFLLVIGVGVVTLLVGLGVVMIRDT
jgi:hypothetical protein